MSKEPQDRAALTPPTGVQPDWQEKIALAKAAREHGKKLREGKPGSFRSAVGRAR